MKIYTNKKINFYTRGQQLAVRVLFILGLFFSCSLEGTLATSDGRGAVSSSLWDTIVSRLPSLWPGWQAQRQGPADAERQSLLEQDRLRNEKEAATLQTLGIDFYMAGNYQEALDSCLKALNIQQELHEGENHVKVATSLNTVGIAYGGLDEHDQALGYFKHALEILGSPPKEEDYPTFVSTLSNLGMTYERLGQYLEALQYYELALTMQQKLHKGENRDEVADALSDVGSAYYRLGQYLEALQYYQKALQMCQELHKGENHEEVAEALSNVGDVHCHLGNYQQALECYQQALEIQQTFPNPEGVAKAFLAVGFANYCLDRLEAVIQNWEQALDVPAMPKATQTITGHHLGCMCHVKALEARQTGNEQQAQMYLKKATTSFEKAIKASSAVAVGLYTEYSSFLLATGKTAQAHDYLHQVIESGNVTGELSYGQLEKQIVTPALQAYISQQAVSLRAIDYAYYLMIHHYEDFQKAGIAMAQTREDYLEAYQASIDQCGGQPGQTRNNKTAYHLLGSLYQAQGEHEAAAAAFARAQDGTEQEDTQATA